MRPCATSKQKSLVNYLNIIFLVDCLFSGNPMHVDHTSAVKKKKKKGSSKVWGWICSVWPSWVWESPHASTGNSISWSLGHSSRSSLHHMAFFPSLKHNFIAYHSSSRPDCISEIHQLWQSGFSRVYSNCCCSCSFEPEIMKIGKSSHKMYSNNILNFQESHSHIHAHLQIHTYTYTRAQTYTFANTLIHTYTHTCIHTHSLIHTHSQIDTHTYSNTHAHTYTYANTHTRTCVHIRM